MEKLPPAHTTPAATRRPLPLLSHARPPNHAAHCAPKGKENTSAEHDTYRNRSIEQIDQVKPMKLKRKARGRGQGGCCQAQEDLLAPNNNRLSHQRESEPNLLNPSLSSNRRGKVMGLKAQTELQTPQHRATPQHEGNAFALSSLKLYAPRRPLPVLARQKQMEKEVFERRGEVTLVDFGIFTDARSTEAFMKRFRVALQRAFLEGVNVKMEEDVCKLEFCLLKEIHHEGNWLEE